MENFCRSYERCNQPIVKLFRECIKLHAVIIGTKWDGGASHTPVQNLRDGITILIAAICRNSMIETPYFYVLILKLACRRYYVG